MRRLIRSFDRSGLEYLLISGQASVLYGAATFSEDVDIWIRPSSANAARLLRALAAVRARVYKLTPPLTPRFMASGHGFHFEVPDGPDDVFLDVMARPPRVGPFEASRRRARIVPSPWGPVPLVSIPDLVLLKRTRRLNDYEVISNLVRIAVDSVGVPDARLLRWAVGSSCRAEDRVEFLRALGKQAAVERCRREIARQVARWQAADVRYWRRIIAELRRLRNRGALLPLGAPVAGLIP